MDNSIKHRLKITNQLGISVFFIVPVMIFWFIETQKVCNQNIHHTIVHCSTDDLLL